MESNYAVLRGPLPIPIAHRGGAGEVAENSLASIEHTISLGYDYLETDVRASADGKVLVVHDADLGRTLGDPVRVGQATHAELVERFGAQAPPLLDEVLTTFPTLRINIDAKEDAVLAPLIKALRRHRATDRVCVASFSDRRLRLLRSLLGPSMASSMGRGEVARLVAAARLPLGAGRLLARTVPAPATSRMPAACAQVPVSMGGIPVCDGPFVELAHSLGLQVHVWTIDEPAEMERLLDLGVDAIMTDRPKVLREVLAGRMRAPRG